ncbi:MAG: helix-turn-helix domain-containing protein [Sphingorhabdus sp.]
MKVAMTKISNNREIKTHQLLDAADGVFMRYGFDRTTMGLLASAAGMSRPALYLLFPGKEEIFSALVIELNDRLLERLKTEAGRLAGIEGKLLYVIQTWNEGVFDVHAAHPESRDMDDLGFAAVRELYDRLANFIALIVEGSSSAGATAKALGRMLAFGARGCRIAARDREDMKSMITQLVNAVASSLA